MKHEFEIHHLGCASCGQKIEDALNKKGWFDEVKINFMLKKVEVETKEEDKTKIATYIEKVANQYENGIEVTYEKDLEKSCHLNHASQEACCCGENEHNYNQSSNHNKNKKLRKSKLKEHVTFILGGALLIGGVLFKLNILFIFAYILTGYDVILNAFKNCIKGRMLDENFLMTLATIAAFVIGEYPEAVAVMMFYKVGEYMQDRAVDYSTKEIEKAMDIRPDFARVLRDEAIIVNPKEVKIGELIEVRPGERIPLDGVVTSGSATLDTSMLTGESLPVIVKKESHVLSGSINQDGVVKIKVVQEFKDSTVSKILELIQNASSKKSKSENFITKFAKWYTPAVVMGAFLTAVVPSLITGNWQEWIYTSIVFLVISCPCALVVSIPLGFFGGIGAASKAGVLVKGSNYLEALNDIDTIVLDKTGTITKGQFGVININPSKVSKEELLKYAAIAESRSNHPIARSIVKEYGAEIPREITISNYKEISGQGITVQIDSKDYLVGNKKLMENYNILFTDTQEMGSHIHIAAGGIYLGYIIVADEVKEDSEEAIRDLKKMGIKKIVMLTGDKKEIADQIGIQVGIDEVHAELLPQDKVIKLEEKLKVGKVAFVGDGINDAPVLARADIGIAMGGVGSDAAIEASDIVLMTDKLSSISDILSIAKKTRRIVTENIVFALGVKAIVLVLGLMGIANMWLAVFADVGVSFLAVLNSIRVLGKDKGHMVKMINTK
ncbi:heavy metal translocating P-type ATPase [Cellulosilyticum sp. I15G10I2]|uniref:heavy metal translocating P-type ATPase n=1 Tax=Cellulosilyticum sp. I15G10I2 TaxID=1892843 RepID=UPI00085BE5E2|nr:heavy metal translocating P-type ATPase [Cellulosilyticum sp. I15G10I2]